MRQQATAHREVRAGLGAGEIYQGRHTMSNTPSDAEIDAFLDSPAGITWVIASNRERYRLLVRAVLAKWGTPQPAPAPLSFDACDMATAAAQGFRSGQAAAKQEE